MNAAALPDGDLARLGRIADVVDPEPGAGVGAGRLARNGSRFVSMTPSTARTLCEWMPVGIVTSASLRGFVGSLTSTMLVPCGGAMWAMNAVVPLTTTWPPPGQSK